MSTWVFLRGLTRESRHWGPFAEAFRERLPDATVVALDLPGNGRLYQMRSPWSVEEMAQYCRKELLDRGLRPPYYLLALSLGAMVAIAWASRQPQELLGCVLINTSLRPVSPFYRRLRPRNYASLVAFALRAPNARKREQTVLRLTSRKARSSADVLDQWLRFAREYPVSRANALRQLIAAARYRAPLTKPPVPLLFLTSAADALVDTSCSRQLAARWDCAIVEHPSAGHDLPLDDGPWVASQVQRWVERLQTPGQ